jgi:hypothetical protein
MQKAMQGGNDVDEFCGPFGVAHEATITCKYCAHPLADCRSNFHT